MEDMARLAVFESNVQDAQRFVDVLQKLLGHIRSILQNPEEPDHRSISSEHLKKSLNIVGFTEYLKYLGFEIENATVIYPKDMSLNKLKMAEAAIERKLKYSCAPPASTSNVNEVFVHTVPSKKYILPKVHLTHNRNNSYLQTVENLFNDILKYEDEQLQQHAREHIPLVTLQTKALGRVREQQMLIKTGKTEKPDLPFDMALLMELVEWFKFSFFTWVDRPPCERCGADTRLLQTAPINHAGAVIRCEVYRCTVCAGGSRFPRYRDGVSLLQSRRGRCGEWADCFALLARSLGFDTRHVHDTTDHVWCEIYDYDTSEWIHVDPCEGRVDAPLMYEKGWNKKLQYVIAVSKDDLQDVTWRYTTDHSAVLGRRNMVSEQELVEAIVSLREQRQKLLSEPRKHYLAKRCLQELVMLMVERQPSTDSKWHGRTSGSREWRMQRGEIGQHSHTFDCTDPGLYCVRYYPAIDKYTVSRDNREIRTINSWTEGVFQTRNIFRKKENDWRMVYLAREEGEDLGSISWKLRAPPGIKLSSLSINIVSKLYENGKIDWTVQFDSEVPIECKVEATSVRFDRTFQEVLVKLELSGGVGDVAWQHSQIFRQSLNDAGHALQICCNASTCL